MICQRLAALLRALADRLDDPDAVAARDLRRIQQTRDAVQRDARSDYVRQVELLRRERFGDAEVVEVSPETRQLHRDIEAAQGIVRRHATKVTPIRRKR